MAKGKTEKAACDHHFRQKKAWDASPGLYVTCALCGSTAHSPKIYVCGSCSVFACADCAWRDTMKDAFTLDPDATRDLSDDDSSDPGIDIGTSDILGDEET